jgi:hypothetical protein
MRPHIDGVRLGTPTSERKEAEMTERPEPDAPEMDAPETERIDPDLKPETERIDPDLEPEPGDDTEVAPSTDDPDLEAARSQAPDQDPMALTTEELRPEDELVEYEPPYEPTAETAQGLTAEDERVGGTLDERLAQEEPDEPP